MAKQLIQESFAAKYRGQDLVTALGAVLAPLNVNVTGHPGWQNRRSSRSGISPQAHITHWTAGSSSTGSRACLNLCVRRNLVTFYNPHNTRDIIVISGGRTGHPGKGNDNVLKQLQGGPPQYERHPWGNPSRRGYYALTGIEMEHNGKTPVTQNMRDVAFGLGAAMCLLMGWGPHRHIHHAHWAGARKMDLMFRTDGTVVPYGRTGTPYGGAGFQRFDTLTAAYVNRLGAGGVGAAAVPALAEKVVSRVIAPPAELPRLYLRSPMIHGSSVTYAQGLLNGLGHNVGKADGWFGNGTRAGVGSYQAKRFGTAATSPSYGMLSTFSWGHLIADAKAAGVPGA